MRHLVPLLLLLTLATACARTPIEVVQLKGGSLATMRPPEDIQSLHDPQLLTVEQADGRLRDDERVLGIEIGDRAVAIALRVLDDHEIVNASLADDPGSAFAATW